MTTQQHNLTSSSHGVQRRISMVALMLLALSATASCSRTADRVPSGDTDKLPSSCETYVATYARCVTRVSVGARDIAEQDAKHLRESLLAQVALAGNTVESLGAKCTSN